MASSIKKNDIVRNYFFRSFNSVRLWIVIAVVLYGLFGLLDPYIVPISAAKVFVVRYYIVLPAMLVLLLSTYFIESNKFWLQVIIILFVVVGVSGLCFMLYFFQPTEKGYHFYFVGFLAAMVWCQIIGFTWKIYTWISIGITLAYNSIAVFCQRLHVIDAPLFLFINLFFITFLAFGYYSSRMIEKFIVADYLNARELDKEKNKLIERQEELAKVNAFKNNLISIIAHDVRGPLASIKGLISLFTGKVLTDLEFIKSMRRLNVTVESLGVMLDTTLIWSSTQSGNYVINKQIINLRKVVNEIYRLLSTQAEQKSIELINKVNESMSVYADPLALNIVLRNLVGNSLKFTPHGGEVEITALPNSGITEIQVLDTGIGLNGLTNDCELDHKNNSQSKNAEHGYGFGLKVSSQLVSLHGGKLKCEDRDKGAKFYFYLPNPN